MFFFAVIFIEKFNFQFSVQLIRAKKVQQKSFSREKQHTCMAYKLWPKVECGRTFVYRRRLLAIVE